VHLKKKPRAIFGRRKRLDHAWWNGIQISFTDELPSGKISQGRSLNGKAKTTLKTNTSLAMFMRHGLSNWLIQR